MVSCWMPHLLKGCRPDFNNGLGGNLNSGPVLAPGVYLSPTYISVQVSYLSFPVDPGAPARNTGRVDVVGLVNTIRLRRYGWNTSTGGSLRRKKEGEKE